MFLWPLDDEPGAIEAKRVGALEAAREHLGKLPASDDIEAQARIEAAIEADDEFEAARRLLAFLSSPPDERMAREIARRFDYTPWAPWAEPEGIEPYAAKVRNP